MLRDHAAHQRDHGFNVWAVVERATGSIIGDAGLYRREEKVELGYTLAHDCWNRGYGTEAARLCVRAAFGELGLDALVAVVRPENAASAPVLAKLGFRPSGHLEAYGFRHSLYRLRRSTSM